MILKVNNQEIANDQDFTWFLAEAGPSSNVSFTVARPDRTMAEALDVKLTAMPDPKEILSYRRARSESESFSLNDQGIETIALRAPVASQLGTAAGLLVVYVEPTTAAFAAGLQPGDVIKSINGRAVFPFRRPLLTRQPATLTFEIVLNKERRTVVVKPAKKKE